MDYADKKVLITGGSGFLGINLIRYLLNKGVKDIRSIDLVPFDYPERDRIDGVVGDIRDKAAMARVSEGRDWVIHAAAALPLYSEEDIFSTDVQGTSNVLEAARAVNADRFVMISSTAVYGVPDHHPLYETDPLIGVGPYGKAKWGTSMPPCCPSTPPTKSTLIASASSTHAAQLATSCQAAAMRRTTPNSKTCRFSASQ